MTESIQLTVTNQSLTSFTNYTASVICIYE